MAALFAPLQIYLGDYSGRVMFHHQPAKLAAIEGHWETNTRGGAPFAVIAFPDMEKERNRFEITIPLRTQPARYPYPWTGESRA